VSSLGLGEFAVKRGGSQTPTSGTTSLKEMGAVGRLRSMATPVVVEEVDATGVMETRGERLESDGGVMVEEKGDEENQERLDLPR
jgi:hypothetical protein